MTSPESVALIRRARDGDKGAWEELCSRYYPKWLERLHGEIGQDLRNLCETVDVVQSAVASALRGIADLRNDGAFFAWVTAIARKKIYEERRKAGSRRTVALDQVGQIPETETSIESRMFKEDEAERVLNAILSLFPTYPDPMSAVYLKYYHKQPIESLAAVCGKSERTIARLLKQGLELLEAELEKKEARG